MNSYLLAGLTVGLLIACAVVAVVIARARIADARALAAAEFEAVRAPLHERIHSLEGNVRRLAAVDANFNDARSSLAEQARLREELLGRLKSVQERYTETRDQRDQFQAEVRLLTQGNAEQAQRVRELETRLEESAKAQKENQARLDTLIKDTEQRFTAVFEATGAKILEEKTAKFTETNRVRLDELLNPFRERLTEFQKKVEETHLAELTGQTYLKAELERLMQLNQQVSTDAKELTFALKGDSKTQGNWGEMLLEKALELSGLVQGTHYELQDSQRTEEGRLRQPDVVIRLPEQRHLVIDSKVSLLAYERYANAGDDETRDLALAEHLQSLRTHVRRLSEKNYPSLYGLDAVDFVLLFVPVEPALLLALREDPGFYEESLRKDVVLVSPTNLLATLRVVNHVWRLERQNRNVEQIGKLGGLLYDGFVNFVIELEKIRKAVGGAGEAVDKAFQQLQAGGGRSLVSRAERLRMLGVKASKRLPDSISDLAESESASPDELPDIPGLEGGSTSESLTEDADESAVTTEPPRH